MSTDQQEIDFDINSIPEPENLKEVVESLMVNPNLSPLNYYNDFTDVAPDPEDQKSDDIYQSGFFKLEDGSEMVSMTIHAMHHHLETDPQKAAEILVSRAVRKMVCFGAEPVAITTMLYHINYQDPSGQFIADGAKMGFENAANIFGIKITDRKIRYDYFGDHGSQSPTLIVTIAGRIVPDEKGKVNYITPSFKRKGNNVFLLGNLSDDIASSDYLEFYHEVSNSPLPEFNLAFEASLVNLVKQLINDKLVDSASPVSKGGVFFSLLRAGWINELGFDITTAAETREDSFLFGESMGRIIVGVHPDAEDEFVDLMLEAKIPFCALGHVTKGEIRIDDESFGYLDKMSNNN